MEIKRFLAGYSKVLKKLGISEIDERVALKDHFVEYVLGYSHAEGDIDFEENRTDLSIYDNEHNKVIVIETKKSTESTRTLKEKWENHAFSYVTAYTKYVILTNFKRLILYQNDTSRTVLADLYLDAIIHRGRTVASIFKNLRLEENQQIGEFIFLTKEELWKEKRYSDPSEFEEVYENKRKIDSEQGFEDLLNAMEKCMDYLKTYTLKKFDEYTEELRKYEELIEELQNALETARKTGDEKTIFHFEENLLDAEERKKIYKNFKIGFERWLRETGRPNGKEEDQILNKELFCEESSYILMGRILFIRICEDKKLLDAPLISDGGIRRFKESKTFPTFTWLWEDAIKDAQNIYTPIFEEGIFDWYKNGNSRLDDILKRIFWHLNHFDFTIIEKDILGNLYERHFPPEKQSKLGGHYTQKPIVRYILDELGYKPEKNIRGKTVIDVGLGSGTFITEAITRYIKTIPTNIPPVHVLKEVTQNFRGFDIDPFAYTIAQIELVFKLIDLLSPRITNNKLKIDVDLKIFKTDTLRLPEPTQVTTITFENEKVSHFTRRKKEILELEKEEHDFVMGNPPYVQRELTRQEKNYFKVNFKDSCYGELNLYRLFLHRIVHPKFPMLKIGGKLGYIVARTWIADKYAMNFRKNILLKNYKICQVVLIPEKTKPFSGVTQATTIIILERIKPPNVGETFELEKPKNNPYLNYDVTIREIESIDQLQSRQFKETIISIERIVHGVEFDYAFLISANPITYKFVETMQKNSHRLEDFIEKDNGRSNIHEGEIHLTQFKKHLRNTKNENCYPLIRGTDVESYNIDIPISEREGGWIFCNSPIYYPQTQKRRIIWGEIANMELKRRIKADIIEADDNHPIFASNTTCYMIPKKDINWNYILGLINSTALNTFFKLYSSNNHVKTRELKRLPIKPPDYNPKLTQMIIEEVQHIRNSKRRLKEIEEKIKDPLLFLKNIDANSVFRSLFFTQIPSPHLSGSLQLSLHYNKVAVTVADFFECKDEEVAKFVYYMLKGVATDLKDIFKIKIPKKHEDIIEINKQYEAVIKEYSVLPKKIETKIRTVDKIVFELYKLSEEEINLVKEHCGE